MKGWKAGGALSVWTAAPRWWWPFLGCEGGRNTVRGSAEPFMAQGLQHSICELIKQGGPRSRGGHELYMRGRLLSPTSKRVGDAVAVDGNVRVCICVRDGACTACASATQLRAARAMSVCLDRTSERLSWSCWARLRPGRTASWGGRIKQEGTLPWRGVGKRGGCIAAIAGYRVWRPNKTTRAFDNATIAHGAKWTVYYPRLHQPSPPIPSPVDISDDDPYLD